MSENTDHIRRMIAFLEKPENLPGNTETVEIRQTHGSVLAFTHDHVFKVKKPIDFGFMDFTTLAKRKTNAEREVRLNRRLCSETYLGVEAIEELSDGSLQFSGTVMEKAQKTPASRNPGGTERIRETEDMKSSSANNEKRRNAEGKTKNEAARPDKSGIPGKRTEGKIVDYAVKMKRLADGRFLENHLEKGENNRELIGVIANRLADFYRRHHTGSRISRYGDINEIRKNCEDNFLEIGKLTDHTINPLALKSVKKYTFSYLSRNEKLVQERVRKGKILECHGDLHIDHIHYHEGRLCIYDCVEFNEAFRCMDIANDLAFLSMDLEHKKYLPEAGLFTSTMTEKLSDPQLPDLMHFYKVYRACVRAKVHGIAGLDESLSGSGRKKNLEEASSYFRLAIQYATLRRAPVVLVMFGPPASGKSTLASAASQLFGIPHISSDAIRKQMFGIPAFDSTPEDRKHELYSQEATERVYKTITRRGLELVSRYRMIVLDATFSRPEYRIEVAQVFEKAGAETVFICLDVTGREIRRRFAERDKMENVISDARLKDYEKLAAGFIPPEPGDFGNNLVRFDNSGTAEQLPARLIGLLEEINTLNSH